MALGSLLTFLANFFYERRKGSREDAQEARRAVAGFLAGVEEYRLKVSTISPRAPADLLPNPAPLLFALAEMQLTCSPETVELAKKVYVSVLATYIHEGDKQKQETSRQRLVKARMALIDAVRRELRLPPLPE